jgi:tRNA modification GTPase
MDKANETIAAIATPPGEGGVAIVRISGPESKNIVAKLFRSLVAPDLWEPRKAYFGRFFDPDNKVDIDEVLVTWFKAPKSFTAEDIIEISSHGGVYVTSRILQLVLHHGARLAEPGEFTKRAFLNGRLDLSQAEAVSDLIHACSEKSLQIALSQLRGNLSKSVNDIYQELVEVLSQVETAIDFPEEGLEFEARKGLIDKVQKVCEKLDSLIRSFDQGKIFREGARIALTGKPNVGKSSLLNTLLKEDRAIVTSIPGTTRDSLEERIRIKDIHACITDTAGFRSNPDSIEQEGINRAREVLEKADLVLTVFDGSSSLDDNDKLVMKEVEALPKITLINKCDLENRLDQNQFPEEISKSTLLKVSAKDQSGIEELFDEIYKKVVSDKAVAGESNIVVRERHRDQLRRTFESLKIVCDTLGNNLSEEFIAVDINSALDCLGTIIGKTFQEDLLHQIFNDFCIGK